MQTGHGRAHAKIILIGEHSVVHQQPAIALPLQGLPVTATLTTHDSEQRLVSDYFSGALSDLPGQFAGIHVLLERLLNRFHVPNLGFNLELTSTIPEERGMGSSAAVATAITRAVYDFFDKPLDQATLLKTVNIEEVITHGTPSGIDAATVSANQPIWFIKGQPLQQLPVNLSATLVVGDTGVTGQTSLAVNSVNELLTDRERPHVGQNLVDHLGQLTWQAATCLRDNQPARLGHLLNQAQLDLAALGVSHPVLEHLLSAANQAGALGSKLTGGGLGGCMISLAANRQSAQKIQQALLSAGAIATWIEPFEHSTKLG